MSEASTVLPDRPTARWLILDRRGRVLLFRFVYAEGPLTGTAFWATPGGAANRAKPMRTPPGVNCSKRQG